MPTNRLALPFAVGAALIFATAAAKPHIIHCLADDFGHADIGYNSLDNVSTPTLDALASQGVKLDNLIAFKYCSPTRSMLMVSATSFRFLQPFKRHFFLLWIKWNQTGRHAIHNGMYNNNIGLDGPYSWPLEFKLIPQEFKHVGYAAYMIG